jgi:hypothetical protein
VVLADLKKQSKMTQSGAGGGKNKKQQDEDEVDIEKLLNEIRTDITEVYSQIGDTQSLTAKKSIEILHDIQIQLFEYVKLMDYVAMESEAFEKELKA